MKASRSLSLEAPASAIQAGQETSVKPLTALLQTLETVSLRSAVVEVRALLLQSAPVKLDGEQMIAVNVRGVSSLPCATSV